MKSSSRSAESASRHQFARSSHVQARSPFNRKEAGNPKAKSMPTWTVSPSAGGGTCSFAQLRFGSSGSPSKNRSTALRSLALVTRVTFGPQISATKICGKLTAPDQSMPITRSGLAVLLTGTERRQSGVETHGVVAGIWSPLQKFVRGTQHQCGWGDHIESATDLVHITSKEVSGEIKSCSLRWLKETRWNLRTGNHYGDFLPSPKN